MPPAAEPAPHSPSTRPLLAAVAIVGAWTLFGALASLHFFWAADARARPALDDLAAHILIFYWSWALLTPALLFAARRLGTGPLAWGRALGLLATGGAGIAAHGLIYLAALRALGVEPGLRLTGDAFSRYLLRHGGGDVATCLVLAGLWFLYQAARRARERELAAAELAARLARADLELLHWRLHPHFVFNALNTVSTLVLKADLAGAERAIELIGGHLRAALGQRPDALVSVTQEVEGVRRYLEIEALRFGAGLRLETSITDDAGSCRLPATIVQPIVENAVRHGLDAAGTGHTIRLGAATVSDRLRVTVTDPGPGAGPAGGTSPGAADPADEQPRALAGDDRGFGVRYVRERLHHVYGEDARFELHADGAGTVAILDLPARRS
jgi:hypothetical protein